MLYINPQLRLVVVDSEVFCLTATLKAYDKRLEDSKFEFRETSVAQLRQKSKVIMNYEIEFAKNIIIV